VTEKRCPFRTVKRYYKTDITRRYGRDGMHWVHCLVRGVSKNATAIKEKFAKCYGYRCMAYRYDGSPDGRCMRLPNGEHETGFHCADEIAETAELLQENPEGGT